MSLRGAARIETHDGAMTPGRTSATVDGMSQDTMAQSIAAIRYERWQWTPGRRGDIPKRHGKTRPLGLPTWSETLLQEVLRAILAAYDDPQCSDSSHGFRPHRGCHTALTDITRPWAGTQWGIEGDITGCCETINHTTRMNILRENSCANRFLRLIEHLLQAGDCAAWTSHPS